MLTSNNRPRAQMQNAKPAEGAMAAATFVSAFQLVLASSQ
jgi:hypothetical protein